MGRPKGSRNKTNVLSGTPHKHFIENMDDKNISTISKESNDVSMRESVSHIGTRRMLNMSQQIHERVAENTSVNSSSTSKNELQSVYEPIRETREDQEIALREMRRHVQSGSPSRLQQASGSNVAMQEMPYEAPQAKERVRQYSTSKDHKGEGEPLCFGCGHRADMHYIEHRWIEQKMGKNLQGDVGMIEIQHRRPLYDGARPCQHACLCKAYE